MRRVTDCGFGTRCSRRRRLPLLVVGAPVRCEQKLFNCALVIQRGVPYVDFRMAAFGAFDSIYTHGFARVAVCTPRVELVSPVANAKRTLDLAHQAAARHAAVTLFPELGLSAYSTEDYALSRGVPPAS